MLAELEAPQTNVRVLELYPAEPILRSEEQPPAPVHLPAEAATVTLLLVPGDLEDAVDHELQMVDADGEIYWRQRDVERQPEGDFAVTLRVDALSPGRYTLQLVAAIAGERRVVADYSVEIERRPPDP